MSTKILIADASDESRSALADELRQNHTVCTCANGQEALELLHTFHPDALVTDLMLPGLDGLSLLRDVQREALCPITVVTGVYFSPYATSVLQELNVDYVVLKPCRIDDLASRIDEMLCPLCEPPFVASSPYAEVTSVLLELGVPSSRKGFRYCREAILMLSREPMLQVTKEVYPAVGKHFGTEADSVEKNIRDVIAAAWQQRDDAVWRRYLPTAPNGLVPRPTNSVFLAQLAEVLFAARRMVR